MRWALIVVLLVALYLTVDVVNAAECSQIISDYQWYDNADLGNPMSTLWTTTDADVTYSSSWNYSGNASISAADAAYSISSTQAGLYNSVSMWYNLTSTSNSAWVRSDNYNCMMGYKEADVSNNIAGLCSTGYTSLALPVIVNHKYNFMWNQNATACHYYYRNDSGDSWTSIMNCTQSGTPANYATTIYIDHEGVADSTAQYIDDLAVFNYTTIGACMIASTVPKITNLNLTSDGGDATSPYNTTDTTPTFTFNTSLNSVCRIGKQDYNWSTFNSTRDCAGGQNTTGHTCTLGSIDILKDNTLNQSVYISCANGLNTSAETVASTSGRLITHVDNGCTYVPPGNWGTLCNCTIQSTLSISGNITVSGAGTMNQLANITYNGTIHREGTSDVQQCIMHRENETWLRGIG